MTSVYVPSVSDIMHVSLLKTIIMQIIINSNYLPISDWLDCPANSS